MWDAVVIGGGVIGCAVARELSVPQTELTQAGGESRLLAGKTKEVQA